jgi:predicted unusual protein kinase regulating ubiquinone biosynthesis (AarF/ABC1/UbiB family)
LGWFGLLPKSRRNRIVDNLRLMQVYNTIRRYGIDLLVGTTPLARFRRTMQGIIYRDKESVSEDSAPRLVRLMLQDLGPTYVKLDQMIASRSEFLPQEWKSELKKLQSEVAPFPYGKQKELSYPSWVPLQTRFSQLLLLSRSRLPRWPRFTGPPWLAEKM